MKSLLITSTANPRIRNAVAIRNRKKKEAEHLVMIEGPNLIGSALREAVRLQEVFVTKAFAGDPTQRACIGGAQRSGAEIIEVGGHVMEKLASSETPQGIVALAEWRPLSLRDLHLPGSPIIAVADGISDPGNLGTLIRTADAAGAAAVVLLEGSCDPLSQKALRASAGSIFHLPVIAEERGTFLGWLRDHGIRLIVTAADSDRTIFDVRLIGSIAIAFGNEAHGVSPELRAAAGLSARIPLQGKAESLNVAASATVVLYEAVRQRCCSSRPR